ncbi:hypothetical protein SLEP1_g1730 [Rubroshorea leprosula]|uniref:tRNA synthetases class I catalytic domain-containing protein n=1 Tax=Rubroshorea leprosula TaxID=152421 RepID=A0AAV5HER6_9ROSI|nr:hypothetical protein SLEP1_g1730 [Rubroshorea leprosula]
MGTVFKCYKPLFLTRFSPIPNSILSVHPSNLKSRSFVPCIGSLSSSQSQPLANGKGVQKPAGDFPLAPTSELWLYNTMTRRKELFKFKPRVEGRVDMYVCGVTAYDLSHIGHACVYITFDVLYRYLKHLGYEVCYVRNFTDVDDKIIARANELGEDPISLSRRYCEEFHDDMVHLCCLLPSVEPHVSDHMPQIIDTIKQILDNGCAYRIDGDVFFSVDEFPEYGRLSGRKLEDN